MATIDKRPLKAYVRFDGTGRIVPSSLILRRKKPKVGKWVEIPAYECCNPTTQVPAFRLVFDSIESADALVGDSANVADWNTFFDLPTYGVPFTSVVIVGSEVKLYGGAGITIIDEAFYDTGSYDIFLLQIIDNAGSIIGVGDDSFYYCTELTNITLPYVINVGLYPFEYCLSLTNVNLSSCLQLGPTVGNDDVFYEVVGNNVILTIPAALMTCNSGSPDGDIQYLQANNTVTIVTT
jgi:hypothetical protein